MPKSKEDLVLDFKEIASARVLDDTKAYFENLDKTIAEGRAFLASALYAIDLSIRERNDNSKVEEIGIMSVLKKSADNTEQYEKFFEKFKSAKLVDLVNALRTVQMTVDGFLIEKYGTNKIYDKSTENISETATEDK